MADRLHDPDDFTSEIEVLGAKFKLQGRAGQQQLTLGLRKLRR